MESNVRLIPACWQPHGLSKGKRREDDNSDWSVDDHQCGWNESHACEKAILTTCEETPTYRLTTSNPEEDLKRWLLTPNDTLTTATDVRDPRVVEDPRYTHTILLSLLNLAIISIRAKVAHIRSLTEYAARPPYEKVYRANDSLEERYHDVQASSFADADRETLERRLLKAAYELRCLRARAANMSKCIEGFKVAEARDGDWAEIGDLLRLGAVDEEWVRNECYV